MLQKLYFCYCTDVKGWQYVCVSVGFHFDITIAIVFLSRYKPQMYDVAKKHTTNKAHTDNRNWGTYVLYDDDGFFQELNFQVLIYGGY